MQEEEISTLLSSFTEEINPQEIKDPLFDSRSITSYIEIFAPSILSIYKSIQSSELYLNSILPSKEKAYDQGQYNESCLFFDNQKQKITNKIVTAIKKIPFSKAHKPPQTCNKRMTKYYSCKDCGDKSFYCVDCFDSEFHRGHLFTLDSYSSALFCDCGNPNMLDKKKWCKNHQNIEKEVFDYEQYEKVKGEMTVLLNLGLSSILMDQYSSQTHPIRRPIIPNFALLKTVLDILNPLVQEYQFYQEIISQILISESLIQKELLIKIIIQYPWNDDLILKIQKMLISLSLNASLTEWMLPLIQKFCALSQSISKKQAQMFKWIAIFTICSNKKCIQMLIKPENINILTPQNHTENQSILGLYYGFYSNLQNINQLQFRNLSLLFISKVPVSSWIKLFHKKGQKCKNSQNRSLTLLYKMFTSLKENQIYKRVNVQYNLEKLINRVFLTLVTMKNIKLDEGLVLFRVIALSSLLLSDFNISEVQRISSKIAHSLKTKNLKINLQLKLTQWYVLILNTIDYIQSGDNRHSKIAQIYFVALLIENIINSLGLRLRLQNIQDIACCQLLKLNNEISFIRNSSSVIKHRFISWRVNLPVLILETRISGNKNIRKNQILQFYRQLGTIHQQKNKSQFKKYATNFVNCNAEIKQYIKQEYQLFKKGQKCITQFMFQIPFNSPLCSDDTNEQTLKRIMYELEDKSYEQFAQKCPITLHFIQQYKIILEECKVNSNYQQTQQFRSILNNYFAILLAIYLTTKDQKTQTALTEFLSNQGYRFILNSQNKKYMEMYIEAVRKKNEKNMVIKQIVDKTDCEVSQFKKKKQMKMKAIKEKQQKFIKANWQQYEKSPQKQEQNVCIVCRLGDSHQPLHYLCYIRYSNILLKNMLNSDEQFLLFTSCGHMIHEQCLANNLDNSKFGASYKCFYCREKSNARIPVNITEIDKKMYQEIYDYILTIISLQKNFKDSDQNSEKQQQEPKQILTEQNFAKQLYRSIFYQIYLYFLTDSQIFHYYMMNIIPILINILRLFCSLKQSDKLIPEDDNIARTIKFNISSLLTINQNEKIPLQKIIINEEKQQQQQKSTMQVDIDNLFLKFQGQNHLTLNTYKNRQKYNIFTPPRDIQSLKRLADKCHQCDKLTDKIKLCLLCPLNSCSQCSTAWQVHLAEHHKGATVSIFVKTGRYIYQTIHNHEDHNTLYRNSFGEHYQNISLTGQQKDYTLDESAFERVIRDIVLDNIGERGQEEGNGGGGGGGG